MPKLSKMFLGGFINNELCGVMSLGWGVRPMHTIKRLFPSLDTKDYWEIGKLCCVDEAPRNFESAFISKCLKYVKSTHPEKKLIFTWADGMLGKVGYVYQASNFLYGGFIWTDTYLTASGEKVHPRKTGCIGGRPDKSKLKELGWSRFKGKQFRYITFLCSHKERKRLLFESTVSWGTSYPKELDLVWKHLIDGKWITSTIKPPYNMDSIVFNTEHRNRVDWFREHPPLSDYAEEGSRENRQLTKLKGLVQFQHSAI